MKIYTKTGDQGMSGLYGGQRLSKGDMRFEAYGTIDELNSWIGYILSAGQSDAQIPSTLKTEFVTIQRTLFDIGAHLATPYQAGQVPASLPVLSPDSVTQLEQSIDQSGAQLPELRNFILPGGAPIAAQCHIARTICRRAERHVVTLANVAYVDPMILRYFNRLSDWLFVVARLINQAHGQTETPWK